MRILLTDPLACTDAFVAELHRRCTDVQVWQWPELPADGQYDLLLAWRLPAGAARLSASVKAVFCFGAGADHLVADPRIPETLPIARLIDPEQAAQLLDYAAHVAFARLFDQSVLLENQAKRIWPLPPQPKRQRRDLRIAVLGLGHMGRAVASGLAELGFSVAGWSRTTRQLPGIDCYSAIQGIDSAVRGADVLINLLPLAADTENLLGDRLFSQLSPGAYLANLGRGGHLDEDALRAALDNGRIAAAWLDAFRQEPLPSDHWLWSDPRIRVTPHNGGLPTTAGAAKSLSAVVKALQAGDPLPGLIRGGRPRQLKISP